MEALTGKSLKHYRVEEALGKGGMGVVYRAIDTKLQRSVALKVLPREFTEDVDRRERFLREARAAGSITHPAIAQIYDVDEVDGVTFMAMELVEGRTVAALIRDRELDVLGAVEIAMQVGQGLLKAHAAGIVHRDIKSENIIVTPDGHAKILDFGLAKLLEPGASPGVDPSEMETIAETQAGLVMGTVAYMSPEQARAQPVDHRSDLFSLGVVLYHMAAGKLPFRGSSPVETLHAIAYEETQPVTRIRANLPASLQRVISRCLRKRPADRYDDAGQLVDALRGVRDEIESGISQDLPLVERLREGLSWLPRLGSNRRWLPFVVVAAAGLLIWLVLARWDWWLLLLLGFGGLIVWRRIKNRPRRLVQRFTHKIRKLPEVRAIARRDHEVIVVVDRAMAKTYVRINAVMDRINERRFFGKPFNVLIRDDVDRDELRGMLQGPGVLHVRDDALD